MGYLDENRLRSVAAGMFRGAVGRGFWWRNGPGWVRATSSRRDRAFARTVTDEWEKATAAGPPTTEPLAPTERSRPSRLLGTGAVLAAGLVAVAWTRRRR